MPTLPSRRWKQALVCNLYFAIFLHLQLKFVQHLDGNLVIVVVGHMVYFVVTAGLKYTTIYV